jgi:hypothetical protein
LFFDTSSTYWETDRLVDPSANPAGYRKG